MEGIARRLKAIIRHMATQHDNDDDTQQGGTQWEFTTAVDALGVAEHVYFTNPTDDNAARLHAARRNYHAALGSQATAMAASIAKPVYDAMEKDRKERRQFEQADLTWKTNYVTADERRRDVWYEERDQVIAAVNALEQRLAAHVDRRFHEHEESLAQYRKEQQDDAKKARAERTALRRQVKKLEGRMAQSEADRKDIHTQLDDVLRRLKRMEVTGDDPR